jgi:hypothetical protein
MAHGVQPFRSVQSTHGHFDAQGRGTDSSELGTIQELVFPVYKGITYLHAELYLPEVTDMGGVDAYANGVLHMRANFIGDPDFPEDLPNQPENDVFDIYGLVAHYRWTTSQRTIVRLDMRWAEPFVPSNEYTFITTRRFDSDGRLMPILCRCHIDIRGTFAPADGTKWFGYWEVGCR